MLAAVNRELAAVRFEPRGCESHPRVAAIDFINPQPRDYRLAHAASAKDTRENNQAPDVSHYLESLRNVQGERDE